ncbi:hypothetical protein HK099_002789, partial [Clydaea vesicula]
NRYFIEDSKKKMSNLSTFVTIIGSASTFQESSSTLINQLETLQPTIFQESSIFLSTSLFSIATISSTETVTTTFTKSKTSHSTTNSNPLGDVIVPKWDPINTTETPIISKQIVTNNRDLIIYSVVGFTLLLIVFGIFLCIRKKNNKKKELFLQSKEALKAEFMDYDDTFEKSLQSYTMKDAKGTQDNNEPPSLQNASGDESKDVKENSFFPATTSVNSNFRKLNDKHYKNFENMQFENFENQDNFQNINYETVSLSASASFSQFQDQGLSSTHMNPNFGNTMNKNIVIANSVISHNSSSTNFVNLSASTDINEIKYFNTSPSDFNVTNFNANELELFPQQSTSIVNSTSHFPLCDLKAELPNLGCSPLLVTNRLSQVLELDNVELAERTSRQDSLDREKQPNSFIDNPQHDPEVRILTVFAPYEAKNFDEITLIVGDEIILEKSFQDG